MASRRPVVIAASGRKEELPHGDGVPSAPAQISSPVVTDLFDGELAVDTSAMELVFRLGGLLYRYAPIGVRSYAGQAPFNAARNSHWIGVM